MPIVGSQAIQRDLACSQLQCDRRPVDGARQTKALARPSSP
jgi:hypothetical protein